MSYSPRSTATWRTSTTSLRWEGTSLPKPPSPSHIASGATQKHPDPYPQKVVRLSSSPQGLIQTNLAPAVLRGAHGCSWCTVLMPWNSIYLTCTLQLLSGSRAVAALGCKSLLLCRIAGFPPEDIQQALRFVSSNGRGRNATFGGFLLLLQESSVWQSH